MKNITYFDPRCKDPGYPDGREITVIANTAEEYTVHRTAILDPERNITLINPLELPETPDPAWFPPKVDHDEFLGGYIAGLMGN